MPEKNTAASAANEYIVRNRMTHWQKTYPHWVSAASIVVLLLFWEAICRCGLVSSLFLPAPSQIISALLAMLADGEIGVSLAASIYRILIGFASAALSALQSVLLPVPRRSQIKSAIL